MTLRMPALGRTITLAAAAALTGGFLAVTPASALDDGDQSFLETVKGLAGYAIGFGMGASDEDEKPRIQYRERAPLVLPRDKSALPAPGNGAAARNPNWPQDYDEARRLKANAAKNRNRDLDYSGSARMSNEELARGRTARPAARNPGDEQCGAGGTNSYGEICNQARYWYVMKNTRSKEDTSRDLQAGVEPDRKALTDPPTGLRRATTTVKATVEAPREEVPLLDAAGQAREEARIRRERYENQ
ncbi:hypothetical protein [Methylocella sp. CPCC 101449]|jgi:hypothetical protein|uniref:hypothetical protein n=1 Tax=Methylocella sp. CPCC 101449 TaxID=2987531 RepID=UPI00288E5D8E|nr:hypothetical protein [Methylocella sp. CPCC 101449]MDT2019652.1 hypothetical protein [Methylocella sp. CPCC 101449]HEV2575444.1 hypothetical protein [Beijerinckiaceae bacterium]